MGTIGNIKEFKKYGHLLTATLNLIDFQIRFSQSFMNWQVNVATRYIS